MKKIIALAVATAISAPAMADLTIGASARYQIDNGTHTPAAGAVPASNSDTAASTSRVLVSFTGSSTAESGLFVSTGGTLQIANGAVGEDGGVAVTIGNAAANVVVGRFEPAGAFNSGSDAFQNGAAVASFEGALRDRDNNNIGLNVTAIEGLTFQVSTNVDSQDDVRVVAGYDFGAFSATAAVANIDGADNQSSITAGTSLGGVALNASYSSQGDASSTNLNASYMGFSVAVQNDDDGANDEQEIYGSYAVANAGGIEGFNVTIGAGDSDADGVDTRYGVRLDYAF